MSSNSNHINPIITLDNYEEYFILYLDNELNEKQVQMVESFLQQNPQLQMEFDLLMETRLPVEEISFDKTSLLSVHMKGNSAQEELLLYLDNELEKEKKQIVEFELDTNPAYQQQYQSLLRAKLDTSEVILHPDKTELYRQKRTVIAFSVWMRVAAAFILVAAMSIMYFLSKSNETVPEGNVALQPTKIQQKKNDPVEQVKKNVSPHNEMTANQKGATEPAREKEENKILPVQPTFAKAADERKIQVQQLTENKPEKQVYPDEFTGSARQVVRTSAIEFSKQSFNTKGVTMDHADPYNNITGSIQPAVYVENPVNNNDNKGSLKTFLRKATRFVEKTTGIDPINGDDELLIGAVALKL